MDNPNTIPYYEIEYDDGKEEAEQDYIDSLSDNELLDLIW